MGTPKRESIHNDVLATLGTISVANGYKTDVSTVEHAVKNWSEVGGDEMPWLGFHLSRESFTHHPFGQISVHLKGAVVGHVNAATAAEKLSQISDLQDDVVAALLSDPTCGGYAIMTSIGVSGDGESDEGEFATIDSKGGSGSFVLPIDIFYIRSTGQS